MNSICCITGKIARFIPRAKRKGRSNRPGPAFAIVVV